MNGEVKRAISSHVKLRPITAVSTCTCYTLYSYIIKFCVHMPVHALPDNYLLAVILVAINV